MRFATGVLTTLVILVLAAGGAVMAHEGHSHAKSFGKGLSGKDTVAISELLAHPDKYVDKTIRVAGVVTGVCAKRGCWMSIASNEKEGVQQTIRIKVEDGVIVFPPEARGKHAVVEGVFVRLGGKAGHDCQEHKAEHSYQIKGTGALIEL